MRARAAAPLRLFARCGDEEERTEMCVLAPPRRCGSSHDVAMRREDPR